MKKTLLALLSILFVCQLAQSQDSTEKQVKIKIATSMGDIECVLYNETPKHRDNFVKLIKEGWFNGSNFHRVINHFMIQGGGNADGRPDPGYKVPAEFVYGKYHKKGALAAARQSDQVNPMKASSGSQFYIVQGREFTAEQLNMFEKRTGYKYTEEMRQTYATIGGTPHLDGGYTVFGEVTKGLELIDQIGAVKTARGDRPLTPVTMSISIIEE